MVKVLLAGHIGKLADKVKDGLESVEGVEVSVYQFPEILSAEVLEKMHAAPKPDVPVLTAETLKEYDAFVFGIPTRYTVNPAVGFTLDEVRAFSPYGAATYAGADGSRQPSELELKGAAHHGAYFAGVAKKLAAN
eukprot:scaffold14.g1071.t1